MGWGEEGGRRATAGKERGNLFTWAARAAQMRNMHGGQAVEAWTSDSAAEHISILEEKR